MLNEMARTFTNNPQEMIDENSKKHETLWIQAPLILKHTLLPPT